MTEMVWKVSSFSKRINEQMYPEQVSKVLRTEIQPSKRRALRDKQAGYPIKHDPKEYNHNSNDLFHWNVFCDDSEK